MRGELEKKLFEKYPKIFRQKDLSMSETAMCWGIDCDDGWYRIIDILCSCIQNYIDGNKIKQVEAVQVKEKFGTLRFYIDGGDDYIRGMIWFAEFLSSMTCEECGSMDNVSQTKGYIKSLCEKCLKKN